MSGLMEKAGGTLEIGLQQPPCRRRVGGWRQIPRRLGCQAPEAGPGLVGSEETQRALKQKEDMVRIYGQPVFGLHGIGLEQRKRDWGC